MKKIIPFLLIIMLLTLSFGAAVNAAGHDIFEALEEANVPDVYVEQARSYFADNPISDEDAAKVISYIKAASAIAGDKTKLSELTGEERSLILAEIIEAGKVLDLTVSYADNAVYVRDGSGSLIFMETSAGAVKQTGHDYSIVLFGLGGMLLAGGIVFLSRKKLNKTED